MQERSVRIRCLHRHRLGRPQARRLSLGPGRRDPRAPRSRASAHQPSTTWARSSSASASEVAPSPSASSSRQGPIVSALLEHDFFVHLPGQSAARSPRTVAPSPRAAPRTTRPTRSSRSSSSRVTGQAQRLCAARAPHMRALRRLVEARRDLVQDRVRGHQSADVRAKGLLPPGCRVVSGQGDRRSSPRSWSAGLRSQAAQRARRDTLVAFFHAAQRATRRPPSSDESTLSVPSVRCTSDRAVIEPRSPVVEALLPQLRALSAGIARLDAEIANAVEPLPDFRCSRACPVPAPCLAPACSPPSASGASASPDAAAVQKYVGVAPVTERSGNKHWVHWRWACPTFLRQTFVEWAARPIPHSFWARAFYDSHRAKGASHNAAVRALAFKWIRILYRCWVDRTPYDESRYLNALQKRQSPLLKFAAAQPS